MLLCLIPEIIQKLENNRAAQLGVLKGVRNEIFSNEKVKKMWYNIHNASEFIGMRM